MPTMSDRYSVAISRSRSSTRPWTQVYSFVEKALDSPPMASKASAMSRAVWRAVPLKSRCSRKCDEPASSAGSSRDPAPIQNPIDAERTSGMASVTTRTPFGRTLRTITESETPSVKS